MVTHSISEIHLLAIEAWSYPFCFSLLLSLWIGPENEITYEMYMSIDNVFALSCQKQGDKNAKTFSSCQDDE